MALPQRIEGTQYRFGSILGLAKLSHERIQRDFESQIAVILSAIAIESFFNDLADLAGSLGRLDESPKTAMLAAVLTRAENERGSAMLKLDLVYLAWAGALPDRGVSRFQDVQLLFSLRNLLVHSKPERVVWGEVGVPPETPNIVKRFTDRGIIERPREGLPGGWQHHLLVPAVSAWAVGTAIATIRAVASIAPDDIVGVWLKDFATQLP